MESSGYTDQQAHIIAMPYSGSVYLEGISGTGKSFAAAARMQAMIESGIPGHTILMLVPQRTLAYPYYEVMSQPVLPAGSVPGVFTLGGLARRMVDLFWPMLARDAGFAHPERPPVFLNVETAQYYMARIVAPLREEKEMFSSVSIDSNRLYSQILSNLNSAAGIGFPLNEISARLTGAWQGKPEQVRIYEDAQDCALRFRAFCLEHNLVDFSLVLEIFCRHLWPSLLGRNYLRQRFRHLIYDNIEEDIPVTHDIVREWLPDFESALLITDLQAGYRSFLGADPESARTLAASCNTILRFEQSLVTPPELLEFGQLVEDSLCQPQPDYSRPAHFGEWVSFSHDRFFPEMLERTSQEIHRLVTREGVRPGEIAVLAPFLSSALRFSLANRLDRLGIPVRSHRPSRSLREEPATQCLLTLAKLAHPGWNLPVSRFDLRSTLMQSIAGLDLVRADLLVNKVHREAHPGVDLLPFDRVPPTEQDRITFLVGQRYDQLREWLEIYRREEVSDLDIFLRRIFGEVLSQSGFGFHDQLDYASVADQLVESVQNFRWNIAEAGLSDPDLPAGYEFLRMIEHGVLGAQYLPVWFEQNEDAVFIAPAHTFLVSNRPVRYQFWLDIGNSNWWRRLDQPITHTYVLSRRWPREKKWTHSDEIEVNHESLGRLVHGLVRRCSEHLYLYYTEIDEHGNEQQGKLFEALADVLMHYPTQQER